MLNNSCLAAVAIERTPRLYGRSTVIDGQRCYFPTRTTTGLLYLIFKRRGEAWARGRMHASTVPTLYQFTEAAHANNLPGLDAESY